MGLFFIYSIKVAFCLIAFYMLYKLLLSRDTFHTFNRFAIFTAAAVSLIVPFVEISTASETPVMQGMIVIEEFVVSAEAVEEGQWFMTPIQTCFLIYLIGVVALFIREIISTIGLFRLIAKGDVRERRGNVQIIVMKQDIAPFSWFNYVIISEKDYEESSREIITHELAHIRLCHSVDVALCNLLIIFQWFNPAAWLLKQELQNVHEFEADEAVLKEGVDARQYQLLLIKKSVGERLFTMANNLNHNSLKKRITMMTKEKSSKWSRAKVLFMVPLTAVAIAAFANQEVKNVSQKIEAESEELVSSVVPAVVSTEKSEPVAIEAIQETVAEETPVAVQDTVKTEKAFDVVEQMPQFPGGMGEMMKWIAINMRYPKEAMEAGIQGRVIVQFIVEKDGAISGAHTVKSVDASLDAEAIRVVSAMPAWTPGMQSGKAVRVKFTIPISFRLTGDGKPSEVKEANAAFEETNGLFFRGNGQDAMVVIDGVKKDVETLKNLNKDDIESITVLKGDKAKEKYGDEVKDGVIEITIKKK